MKNKILTISIIFILISLIFINNVFAYSEEFEYNNTFYEMYLPDGAYNTIIELEEYKNGEYDVFVLCGNSRVYVNFFPKEFNLKIWKKDISGGSFYSNSDLIDGFYCNHYVLTESGEIVETVLNRTEFATTTKSDGYYVNGSKHYFYTNMNVYTDSSCTDFFFKSPVTEPEIPETVEIPAVETVEQIPVAMTETLKLIIPVGLVVLSVVLVIYLARRLIYRSL